MCSIYNYITVSEKFSEVLPITSINFHLSSRKFMKNIDVHNRIFPIGNKVRIAFVFFQLGLTKEFIPHIQIDMYLNFSER